MARFKFGACNTAHTGLLDWVEEVAQLTEASRVFWCNGSESERNALSDQAEAQGILIKLNQVKWPGCYLHRTHEEDVARAEECTYVCTESEEDAGPTNNWMAPREMHRKLEGLLQGCMQGRTMYVVPYVMGPPGSAVAKVGVEVTDSLYVVLSMGILTRMGELALEQLGDAGEFLRGIHSSLDLDPERRYIAHFPQENSVISVGSNYGGNALLAKKSHSLRLGSCQARTEHWMAEHMTVLKVTPQGGEATYVAAAFPGCGGKTNFAMMVPSERYDGWKVETLGDDVAWMWPGADGRLYAVNPEAGYFGVLPGTNTATNPNALRVMARNTLFTNAALLPDGDIWWEGKDGDVPAECVDWRGQPWTPRSGRPAAHPNARFTSPMENNPALAGEVNAPEGVPISAIIFGGRRASTIPLVFQAFNWVHGVYVGATMGSEGGGQAGAVDGGVRRDPMAMLPFCGYDMGDYFRHWLGMRKRIRHLPRVFHVNWFRRDAGGSFLWPGFSENIRVLRWIVDRCHYRVGAEEGVLGWMPLVEDFDLEGLEGFGEAEFAQLQATDGEELQREVLMHEELFMRLRRTLPKEFIYERHLLISRL
jgi:phosphoenolpyruvate carboxykinase (GTP)